ncbi:MAG: Na+/H+ antiporter subunit C [Rhizobiaceae bacterium]|jgi:multicomponent Na+:H+ antiporter subunit C|nr:Na+/H+ antiporter subunit C [Rhizobiaceae bacterium]
METLLALLIGVYLTAAVYLMISKHTIRLILGVALLSNGVNLLIFTAGRLTADVPPIIAYGSVVPAGPVANPLPQALVLTAIVIGFSFFAFLLVLTYRAYRDLGTDDSDHMKLAEPDGVRPPQGY